MTDIGRGRHLAEPQFADDDGSAASGVAELLAAVAAGDVDLVAAARALRSVRLLAAVIAVLDELDDSGGDKDSHMAVVSMVNASGSRGMLAFTSTESMARWNPEGRPVPAWGRDLGRAALDDQADALVIDVAGPVPVVLPGPLLLALAAEVDLERVEALIHSALAPLTSDGWVEVDVLPAKCDPTRQSDAAVRRVESHSAGDWDVLVVIRVRHGGHPDGRSADLLAQQAAALVAGREDIQRLVPGGLGLQVEAS